MSRTSQARESASATLGSIETCWPPAPVTAPSQPGACVCDDERGLVVPVLLVPAGGSLNGGVWTSPSAIRLARASFRVGPPA